MSTEPQTCPIALVASQEDSHAGCEVFDLHGTEAIWPACALCRGRKNGHVDTQYLLDQWLSFGAQSQALHNDWRLLLCEIDEVELAAAILKRDAR